MSTDEPGAFLSAEPAIEAVQRLTLALHRVNDPTVMKCLALDTAIAVIGVEAGSILTYNSVAKTLVFDAVRGPIAHKLQDTSISVESGRGVVVHVWLSGDPQIVADAAATPEHNPQIGRDHSFETRSLLTSPLRARNAPPYGVIQLVNKQQGVFDERDFAVLNVIGGLLAMCLENAALAQEASLAAVARSLGELGHDIGNMLSGVLPYVQMLGEFIHDARSGEGAAVAALDSFYAESLTAVTDSVAQIQALAREVAAAVKGEIGGLDLADGKPLDVARQVVRALSEKARARSATLTADGDDFDAMFDRRRLYNAIFNLANNALDEVDASGRVAVVVTGRGSEYEIRVSDNGRGMTDDVRMRLFTDAAVSTKAGGTGLGTRIVRRVVEQHGGRFAVHSALGAGTTITLTLPVEPDAAVR
ncbi:MAG: ATP-binding protein [Capsulimonadaceae bacterium]|nr:ATP-binding protein [Capsulimonadaceae bacterium]